MYFFLSFYAWLESKSGTPLDECVKHALNVGQLTYIVFGLKE